jgi:pyruvate,orthophosphate dikinase
MYRAGKINDLGKAWVYNFEVESENELDKNFVVFTKMYTPLLVSNSHAAVVARGMGKCCVAGCEAIIVDEKGKTFRIPNRKIVVKEGDLISIDGSTGEVFLGQMPLTEPEISGEFGELMKWVDGFKRLKVKANADIPRDAEVARKFGAEGIGLCRTEHMFFKPERIMAVREMILAETLEERKKALNKILPYQKEDFKGLFKVMSGLPIIIRLLDPPLHEFLPQEEKDIKDVAGQMHVPAEKIKDTIKTLHEFNPMLGFRGCRLGVKYPEINEMQVRAIFEAALESKNEGFTPLPEIEVPLVGDVREFLLIRDIVEKVAEELKVKGKIKYRVGTMIEVPRAAITADEIAKEAEFMSFGTNDLTQMGCGFSRDDAGKFLGIYVEKGVYKRDPFQSIDQGGVGKLMQICIEKSRNVKPDMDIGICGEHGGDPESVKFCHRIGLTDVSCSPYRVPIAKLAAAQAVIEEKRPAKQKFMGSTD